MQVVPFVANEQPSSAQNGTGAGSRGCSSKYGIWLKSISVVGGGVGGQGLTSFSRGTGRTTTIDGWLSTGDAASVVGGVVLRTCSGSNNSRWGDGLSICTE